ncbi:menaquinone-dependent protoporphyrinogen IX dehydrogenase [Oxalicibacterium faecigallinarum]|uniref:Protoporphyrinogen IX dehydrogenase [quinone] n=1 Tax=Oxalicibacterium faecigallinarum TaxID=573741 RepID=A0A8J3ARB6_9BURK|nr:menaquinone-dependent protoporphyrinogen IX dehydrogenase [Oxalicibacterium faecigallinarum]GGI20576.1 protoporphyrinogen oxidase [Oxalicibacterium faecigallinarum]
MHVDSHILIVYSTIDGHTRKICQSIQRLLEDYGHQVALLSVEEAIRLDCSGFDCIVIGASIRYGKHHPSLYNFIQRHRVTLAALPSAFFSVSGVARNADKATRAHNPYFKKFVAQAAWSPQLAAMFGGKIDYAKYRFFDRQMIRFIMWMTGGPTDLNKPVEFTDWSAVDAFALQIKNLQR